MFGDCELDGRVFDVAAGSGLETEKSFDNSRLVTKVLPGAGEKTVAGLAGMEGALTFDFIAEDAGLDGGDVHVFEVGEMEGCFRGGGELRGGRGRRRDGFAENAGRVEAVAAGVLGGASFAGGGAGLSPP